MQITNPEYNRVYSFDFKLDATTNGQDISHLFMDTIQEGSCAGRLSEKIISCVLSSSVELATKSNAKGYDLVSREYGKRIECKALTRNGVKTCKSSYIGAKRSVPDRSVLASEAAELDFAIIDVTEIKTGHINFVFLPGEQVAEQHYSLPFKKARSLFFESGKPAQPITCW